MRKEFDSLWLNYAFKGEGKGQILNKHVNTNRLNCYFYKEYVFTAAALTVTV